MGLFLGRETEENEEKPDASRAGHPPVMDAPIPLYARDGLDLLAPLTPLPRLVGAVLAPLSQRGSYGRFLLNSFVALGAAVTKARPSAIIGPRECGKLRPVFVLRSGEFRRKCEGLPLYGGVTLAIKMRTKVLDVAAELSDPRKEIYTAKLFLW